MEYKKILLSEILDPITAKCEDIELSYGHHFIYFWNISNFRYYFDKNVTEHLIESPIIHFHNIKLRLILHYRDEIILQIRSLSNTFGRRLWINLTIIGEGNKEDFIEMPYEYRNVWTGELLFDMRCQKNDLLFSEENGLLLKHNLIVKCLISYVEDNIDFYDLEVKFSDEHKLIKRNFIESTYFEQLFETGNFSDLKLVVDNEEFQVHKSILSMYSPVFSSMFEEDMKKSDENIMEIIDVKYEVLQEVLRYIYTGKINNFSKLGKEILAAASKYEINELKNLCEEEFISTLNIENVEEISSVANRFNADNLKIYISKFLKIVSKDLNETESSKYQISKTLESLSLKN